MGNPVLEKIKYQAQVNEVARLREKAAPQPKGEHKIREGWIWGVAGAAVLILLISLVFPLRKGRQATTESDNSPKDTFHAVPYFQAPDAGP
jgi:predicted cobalt transporter CbtA